MFCLAEERLGGVCRIKSITTLIKQAEAAVQPILFIHSPQFEYTRRDVKRTSEVEVPAERRKGAKFVFA